MTLLRTISPEILASRPTTILFGFPGFIFLINVAYAAVNFTISIGFNPSPAFPPMVLRIPAIVLINDIMCFYNLIFYSISAGKHAALY